VKTHQSPAVASFIADLNELLLRAGKPSLGELVQLSDHKMSKSTLEGHLSGQRVGLPSWRLVSAYVTACHRAAQRTGIDRGALGTLKQWQARWDAAIKGLPEPPDPFAEGPTEPIEGSGDSENGRSMVLGDRRAEPTEPLLRRLLEQIEEIQETLTVDSALLAVTSGPKFGDCYDLRHNITTIGRSGQCDIWLNDPFVSRQHARICRCGDNFTISDLDSTNGTFCQDRRVLKEISLISYDELKIGPFRLLFVQGGSGIGKLQPQRYRSVQSHLIRDSAEVTTEFEVPW
jgi:pSer/pThr/pTyr-binding forkhead associated (FHA) protein